MALSIGDSCVNCWACYDVCPSNAISQSSTHFKISARKCTECEDDYAQPQCASICPIEDTIFDAQGISINPPGTLTGIPPEKMAEAMREIQSR
ncbi:4Fe-4S dicluster domain-containing protein [Thalassolituus sp.]|uniref:4Fe-4S dicluster domain-containing protein n=1 Tax=Thalassolituus sp. TaxID=2030822 RepID=UPI002A81FE9C|nr:4Fe-4S dicluster domain-containing protein [Thalassolituus sp.]|tara:strand:- start:18515 stop:18793 length:279 start_codon:yes stop_codon:yes gene_type:complete